MQYREIAAGILLHAGLTRELRRFRAARQKLHWIVLERCNPVSIQNQTMKPFNTATCEVQCMFSRKCGITIAGPQNRSRNLAITDELPDILQTSCFTNHDAGQMRGIYRHGVRRRQKRHRACPLRAAASADRRAAPVACTPPEKTTACPRLYLCASTPRAGRLLSQRSGAFSNARKPIVANT